MAGENYSEGVVPAEVRALSDQLCAFELLVGSYTIAHYRVLRGIASHHVVPLERLPIFLTDIVALRRAGAGSKSAGFLRRTYRG